MSTQRRKYGPATLVSLLGLIFWPSTKAVTQERFHEPPDMRRAHTTLQLQERSEAASRLAHQRYRFLRRLRSEVPGGFDLPNMIEVYNHLLFPVGSADRAYALTFGDSICCYDRKHGKDKLIYRVALEQIERPLGKGARVRAFARPESLLEFITSESTAGTTQQTWAVSYRVKGPISKYATRDLAAKRDYVVYWHDGEPNYSLHVSLLSDSNESDAGEMYMETDDDFYRLFGLPVDLKEIPLLRSSQHTPMHTQHQRTRRSPER